MAFTDQEEIKTMLNDLKSDLRSVSEKVIELSVINRNHESTSLANSSKIENIESEIHFAKGSIALFKAVGLTLLGSAFLFIITFGTWVVMTNQTTQLSIAEVRKYVAILDHKVKEIKLGAENEEPNK